MKKETRRLRPNVDLFLLILRFLPAALLLFLTMGGLFREIGFLHYGWDVDHFMYFSGRLLDGDLHWTVEFDDKLPVQQFLFALPALLSSVRVWQSMSAFIVLVGCVAAYPFLVTIFRETFLGLQVGTAKTVALYSVTLMACLYSQMPGGFTHINAMAASFALLSIVLLDLARRRYPVSKRGFACAFLLAGFCASMAIGIRPYFLFSLLSAGVWFALKSQPRKVTAESNHLGVPVMVSWSAGWIACVGLWGCVVNVLPYLLVGKFDVFLSGCRLLAQPTIPSTTHQVVQELRWNTLTSPIPIVQISSIVWTIALILVPYSVWRGKRGLWGRATVLDVGYLLVLAPLLTGGMIFQKHFRSHYVQMFVPFMGIGIGFLAALLSASVSPSKSARDHSARWGKGALVVVVTLILCGTFGNARAVRSWVGRAWQEAGILRGGDHNAIQQQRADANHNKMPSALAALESYLATRPEDQRDFMNPWNMYFHWQLREPRHGFPHAANSRHIARGWWANVVVPEPFELPTDMDSYCEMIESRGPSLIVEVRRQREKLSLPKTDFMEHRLSEPLQSRYVRVKNVPDLDKHGVIVFERRP